MCIYYQPNKNKNKQRTGFMCTIPGLGSTLRVSFITEHHTSYRSKAAPATIAPKALTARPPAPLPCTTVERVEEVEVATTTGVLVEVTATEREEVVSIVALVVALLKMLEVVVLR